MKNIILILSILFSFNSMAKSVKLEGLSKNRSDVKVHLPRGFKKKEKWPLIISMHGYGGSAAIQKYYVRLRAYNNKLGFVYAAPEGLKNKDGKGYWNASNFCCDFEKEGVDDVAYIKSVVDAIATSDKIGRIDMERIYLIGYSNGAFLASKIACSNEIKVAGLVTISGTSDLRDDEGKLMQLDRSLCEHNRPIPVLHVHGTDDTTIPYEGKDNGVTGSVGALAQVSRWADQNACKGELQIQNKKLNATNFMRGRDTDHFIFGECQAPVEHFRINKGVHFGIFKKRFSKAMLNFLLR